MNEETNYIYMLSYIANKTDDDLADDYIGEIQDYINDLQSNWNSLREWLKTRPEGIYHYNVFEEILNKMNELEGRDKEC